MSTTSDKVEQIPSGDGVHTGLTLKIMSFGYKMGKAPSANALFDVRFLKNPFWVEHLRPLTGKDKPVQEYVMNQKAASDFLDSVVDLLSRLVPTLRENKMSEFNIAFGCTGGQHRSATMVELLAKSITERFPEITVEVIHRELDGKPHGHGEGQEDGK